MRHVLSRIGLAAAALSLAASAQAGPTLACPDGPDPLRFRPEFAIADVANEPEPVAVAAARDGSSGREWVAVALLTPAHEVAVALSGDGGCTFGTAGGGFAPTVVSTAGDIVTERPSVALSAAPGQVRLVAAWRAGARAIVRGTDATDGTFAAAVQLDDAAAGAPRLSASAGGPPIVAAAWLHAGAGGAVPAQSACIAPADTATWSAMLQLAPPGTPDDVAIACDLSAGGADARACTMLVTLAAGEARLARSDDAGGPFTTWTRVDDGSPSRMPLATLAAASTPDASGFWVMPAWVARERVPAGQISMDADARAASAGVVNPACDGSLGRANAAFGTAPETRPAAAVVAPAGAAQGFVLFERANEVVIARRMISTGSPRLQGGCGPVQLTGLSPARGGGTARAPQAASLGDDVVLAFVDDRNGPLQVFFKRSDSAVPSVVIAAANSAGCGNPARVDLQWALPCDAALVTVEVGTAPGGTDFTRTAPATAAGLSIEGLEPGATYYFRLRVLDTAGNEGVGPEVSAVTPSCSNAKVDATVGLVTDSCVSGGAGGNGAADPGETLLVTVRFRNNGTDVAPGARVSLLPRTGALTVRTPPQLVGDIAPGGFTDVRFEVDVSVTIACAAPLELLARTDAGGAAWSDLLLLPANAACTPCVVAGCGTVADASRTAPRTICRGASTTLDAGASTTASCAGVPVFEWWSGGTLLGTSSAITQSPAASTTYRLVVRCSTDLGCMSETTVDVVVNQRPSVTIDQQPPPPHCAGDVVTLTAWCSDPAGTFAWSDGTTSPAINATTSGTYSVTATDSNGCTRTRSVRLDFGVVPAADAGPDVTGCGWVLIGTPGYPLLDYEWSPAAGLSDPRVAQPLASPFVPTTYTLTVTDPLTGCSATDTVDVVTSTGPGPYAAFRVGKAAGGLAFSWEAIAGAAGVRVYAEADVREARYANRGSATARLLCEGATTCTAGMPAESLIFLQAVGVCLDGVNEGPN